MEEGILKADEYSSSKKILIATGIYPPDIGGPATYSKQLFDNLPLHGLSVSTLSFGEVRQIPKILRHFVYFLKILKNGIGADIIFAQDPVSVGFPACLASKILRKKFALKIVGDYAWEQYQNESVVSRNEELVSIEDFQSRKFGFVTELRKQIERYVANRADKIIVPSQYLKNIVLKWGVDENKIKVIYNSFEPPSILDSKEDIKREFGLKDNIIVSAGRLVKWKGFGQLIDIMRDVLKDSPNTSLIIIGDGPERENLKSKILNLSADRQDLSAGKQDFKFDNNIILTGKLPREELFAYLKAADIFVLNTAYEGFSHQLLEAMALDIPVITTNIGGNPEIIQDEINGLLVEYNNKEEIKKAILRLLSDEKLRNILAQNAKEKIKHFSKERMINETIKILI